MKVLRLIIAREYLSRIKKRSFIILTILMPLLIIGLILLPVFLTHTENAKVGSIVVIDSSGKYASSLKSTDKYIFQQSDLQNNNGSGVLGILQITEDILINPEAVTFFSDKQPSADLIDYINIVLSDKVKEYELKSAIARADITPHMAEHIYDIINLSPKISIKTLKWDENDIQKEALTEAASIIGSLSAFIMYFFILMYGSMVMNGVIEEKSNRIVEVMVASVRPFHLMIGKIIGIGLTGLTQFFIWIFFFSILFIISISFFKNESQFFNGELRNIIIILKTVNWIEFTLYFLLLFIGGFLMYASIFAMFGAAVDNPQDTQQFMMPVSLIFIFAFYAGIYSIQNPNGAFAFWCSVIPLTSPIVLMVRIAFGIPLWQKLCSLIFLYITIIFVIRFAAKIYRIGILMYGKKVTLSELLKWFRYT